MRSPIRYSLMIFLLLLLLAPTAPPAAENIRRIPCLSGFVRDRNGNPVSGGDLDFIVPQTGVKLITPGDNTDGFGFYNVCVLPGIYRVTYAPPLGTRLMGKKIDSVDLTLNQSKELNVVLDFGTVVSGLVTGPAGNPIGDIDLDADRLTGGRVFTPDDNTSLINGTYRIVIPNGRYRLRLEPPTGSRWRGHQIDSVTVAADTTIDVTLVEGVLLQGQIRNVQGITLPRIDVELRDQTTGAKIFLASNTTDATGNYSVAVPNGVFQLRFAPRRGSRFVGELIDGFTIAGDQVRDQVLETGVVITTVVRDTTGNLVRGVDFDFKIQATGVKVFTPNDKTNLNGEAIVTVRPGTYTIQLDPPPGTTFDQLIVPSVRLQADTTIFFELPEVARVAIAGRVTDDTGLGLPGVKIEAHLRPTGTKVFLPLDATDSNGNLNLQVPLGIYDIFIAPPIGSRTLGTKIFNVAVTKDSTWSTVALDDGLLVAVTVANKEGNRVQDADLDFLLETTGAELYTPHDNTDAQGTAIVSVPTGSYNIVIVPGTGSGLASTTVRGITIQSDTTLAFTLPTRSQSAPSADFALIQNHPNPFSAETVIPYLLTAGSDITISVYNVLGQRVKVLERGFRAAQSFETTWDGTNSLGQRVAGGVYFVRLQTDRGVKTRKIQLVR